MATDLNSWRKKSIYVKVSQPFLPYFKESTFQINPIPDLFYPEILFADYKYLYYGQGS